ncbi:MAG TPA: TonB-dependent receptor, partial [Candidatus Latescibacteria bacterium]|nr:TonB-dependent receptor [Candidatus Latescibacterota bacterium]
MASQTQVNSINPVSESTENNLPKHRATATLTRRFGELSAMARANFYGKTVDERGDREKVGAETLVDLELNYKVDGNITVIAGASNLFDNFPDEIDTRLSQGMPYPRRTPIGYHGGMGHLRLVYHPRLADHLSRGSGEAPGPSWSGG